MNTEVLTYLALGAGIAAVSVLLELLLKGLANQYAGRLRESPRSWSNYRSASTS